MSGTFSLLPQFTPTPEYPARRADAAGDLYPGAHLTPGLIYAASVRANLLPLQPHSVTVVAITCGGGVMNWADYTFVDYRSATERDSATRPGGAECRGLRWPFSRS